MERFTDLLFLAQVAVLFGVLSWWLTPTRHPGAIMLAVTLLRCERREIGTLMPDGLAAMMSTASM